MAYEHVTKEQLRAFIEGRSLSQKRFSQIFHVQERQVQRWLAGDAAVPGPVTVLVRLIEQRPELLSVLEGMAGPPPPDGRRTRHQPQHQQRA